MAGYSGGADDAAKRERERGQDVDFPGLNPELAAAGEDAAVGSRQAVKAGRSDSEMAAELAAPDAKPRRRRRAEKDAGSDLRGSGEGPAVNDAGRSLGLFALAMAVASLFVWALPLGLTAAVLGWISFREGARGLGVWAVTIGLAAALSQLVLIPIQAAW